MTIVQGLLLKHERQAPSLYVQMVDGQCAVAPSSINPDESLLSSMSRKAVPDENDSCPVKGLGALVRAYALLWLLTR